MCEVYNNVYGFDIPDERIPSDEDLIRLQNKDEEVISLLVEGMLAYVMREIDFFLFCTPAAQPYAEDCRSEAMLALVEFVSSRLGRKYTPAKLLGHAKLACLQKVYKWLREEAPTIRKPATSSLRTGMLKPTSFDEIELLYDEDFNDSLQSFLGLLDADERQLVLWQLEGFSFREMGRRLGLTSQHVSDKVKRLVLMYLEGVSEC